MRRTIQTVEEFFCLLECGVVVWGSEGLGPISNNGWLKTRDMAHIHPASRETMSCLIYDFIPRGIYSVEVE